MEGRRGKGRPGKKEAESGLSGGKHNFGGLGLGFTSASRASFVARTYHWGMWY